LVDAVSSTFERRDNDEGQIKAVIIRNHGVVVIRNNVYQANTVIESLEEWAKIHAISKVFSGPKDLL
jgi:ribulose-5-phosphate 4-epimerase/fuculose-1-phosphate aldolase